MKKSLISIFLITIVALGGCQKSSDTFLAYNEGISSAGQSVDDRLTEGDFFAKNVAVVTGEDNVGGDEQLVCGAALLIDITDNKVLYADHVYDMMYPASLAKLLTTLVVLSYGELTDTVTVSYEAAHIHESGARVCGYEEGDVISMEALLNSLLIYSGNDAAIAIADHVGGNEEGFVKLMNVEAKEIGAVQSNFINSHGLHDDNQYTTAYDMYLIFNELLKYDTFQSVISSNSYTAAYADKDGDAKQKTLNSTNLYLTGEAQAPSGMQVVGGLSGTTRKAGSCQILLSKDDSGKAYISVILNASDNDSMYSQMTHLLSLAAAE
jgi:D-alanyl-D-alanine carboxypeptidase (penicillin-binding protein 5/6)